MTDKAPPAFQFYSKDWLGDDKVLAMDWDARAMHMHCICIAWQQHPPCTLPDDDDQLQRWLGRPAEWDRLKPQIFAAWELRDGRWVQKGLLRSYMQIIENKRKRAAAANKRWRKRDAKPEQNDCNADEEHELTGCKPDANDIQNECNASDLHMQNGCPSSSSSDEDGTPYGVPDAADAAPGSGDSGECSGKGNGKSKRKRRSRRKPVDEFTPGRQLLLHYIAEWKRIYGNGKTEPPIVWEKDSKILSGLLSGRSLEAAKQLVTGILEEAPDDFWLKKGMPPEGVWKSATAYLANQSRASPGRGAGRHDSEIDQYRRDNQLEEA